MPAVAATSRRCLSRTSRRTRRRCAWDRRGDAAEPCAAGGGEQFALLEAAHPGRIDLGIGRAPGSDPVTSLALRVRLGATIVTSRRSRISRRRGGADECSRRTGAAATGSDAGELHPQGHAAAETEPKLWLLGSSMYSRIWPRRRGCRTYSPTTSRAGHCRGARAYRSEFRSSDLASEPLTFLTVNAVVAETRDEAMALLLPNLQMMARLRTGQPLGRSISSRMRATGTEPAGASGG